MEWYEKFKVGQEVKVIRKTGNWNYGEPASWVPQMDSTVGKVYKIRRVDKSIGCQLTLTAENLCNYWYPAEALVGVKGIQLLFKFYEGVV